MVVADELTAYDGVGLGELARQLGVPRCLAVARVSSVLDVVHSLGEEGAPNGTLVLANEQTAGRGRQGRRWHSPAGGGIWLGQLQRSGTARQDGTTALRVGMAVSRVLRSFDVEAWLKWPNDIVVCHRKLAGVLCEARWAGSESRWIAVGIGINMGRGLPAEVERSAIALEEVAPGVSRVAVLKRLVPLLARLPASPRLAEGELHVFAESDWLNGRRILEPVDGTARGIAPDGALLVETESGVVRVFGGGVVAE